MKSLLSLFKNQTSESTKSSTEEQLSAESLKNLIENSKIKVIPLDVRSYAEYNGYHIEGALHIHIVDLSIESLQAALNLQPQEKAIVVTYCNAGGRGGRSFSLLKEQNNNSNIQIKNLTHGINEWINKGYPINN
ncbi:MAG: rhodanese-like domain-containing protein [Alphaproteobacteria bacterium]|jgi:rhodanese-related sulfurtransferase|nr:rhodanese-like domain-containing protein [Alphaproteobacteria bacterium]